MIYAYIVLLLLLLVLLIVGKILKLNISGSSNGISKPFLAAAILLHHCKERILGKFNKKKRFCRNSLSVDQLAKQLHTLNPGESSETQLYHFRVERTAAMLLILFIATLIALLITITAVDNNVLQENSLIYRNTFGGVDIIANLTAGIDDDEDNAQYNYEIVVKPQKYTEEEAADLFEQLSGQIDEVIKADNDSLGHILYKVDLPKTIEGYPFSVSWESSDYSVVDTDGQVHNKELPNKVLIDLTGDFSYEGNHWLLIRTLTVCPYEYTPDELTKIEIENAILQNDEKTKTTSYLELPKKVNNRDLFWEEKNEDESYLILILGVMICVLLIPIKESEVKSQIKKRAKNLLMGYPAFVSKIVLYLSAGMSIRNCFLRMGREYENQQRNTGQNDYLGNEIVMMAHELEMGISDSEALSHFGKRCGTKEYLRFTALLVQNLKKGSSDLQGLLEAEALDAFELRKNEARKLGEEASTKLLVPMIMMLGVVMVIIMIPAYMSFST